MDGEAKPLPYLLAQMNLLLHGQDAPDIDPENSLRFKISEIGEKDRVDVILTNPPFGGEEERGLLSNFPPEKQTAETAILFLQLIMRRLRRQPGATGKRGRAAVVVPNGTLYEDGVTLRVRAELVDEYNLHTVVRLPKGVFQPYTDIATNVLFFEAGEPGKHVWIYEHPLPKHRQKLKGKCYSASEGPDFSEFLPMLGWWNNRTENEFAWKVSRADLRRSEYDLALIHPRHEKIVIPTPEAVAGDLRDQLEILRASLEGLVSKARAPQRLNAPKIELRKLLIERDEPVVIEDEVEYTRPRIQLHFRGAKIRDKAHGSQIGTKRQTRVHTGDLILSKIDARHGAMALIPSVLVVSAINDAT